MGYVRISSLLAQISAISSLTVIFPLGTVLMLFALLPPSISNLWISNSLVPLSRNWIWWWWRTDSHFFNTHIAIDLVSGLKTQGQCWSNKRPTCVSGLRAWSWCLIGCAFLENRTHFLSAKWGQIENGHKTHPMERNVDKQPTYRRHFSVCVCVCVCAKN